MMSNILKRLPNEQIWVVGITQAQLDSDLPFDVGDRINLADLIEHIRQDLMNPDIDRVRERS